MDRVGALGIELFVYIGVSQLVSKRVEMGCGGFEVVVKFSSQPELRKDANNARAGQSESWRIRKREFHKVLVLVCDFTLACLPRHCFVAVGSIRNTIKCHDSTPSAICRGGETCCLPCRRATSEPRVSNVEPLGCVQHGYDSSYRARERSHLHTTRRSSCLTCLCKTTPVMLRR